MTCPPAIRAALAILETGHLPSPAAYSRIAILEDGAGISYGLHQCTDRAGSLDAVVLRYLEFGGTVRALDGYLPDLARDFSRVPSARRDELVTLLEQAGRDPVMWRAQDEILEERYWQPTWGRCEAMRLVLPLSWLTCYDTAIQSGPPGIDATRELFSAVPPSRGGAERTWTYAYLRARRSWLAGHRLPAVRGSVYRCDELLRLVAESRWDLRGASVLGHALPE